MPARWLVAGLALIGLTAFAPAPFPKTDKTPTLVEGTWTVVEIRRGGPTGSIVKGFMSQARIQNGKWTFVRVGKGKLGPGVAYEIVLDTTKKPTWIDLTSSRLAQVTPAMRGIIELQGNTMRMMYATPKADSGRPIRFENRDRLHVFMTFHRATP